MLIPSGATAMHFLTTQFLLSWLWQGKGWVIPYRCVGTASEEICQRIIKLPNRGSRELAVILFHPGPFTEWAPRNVPSQILCQPRGQVCRTDLGARSLKRLIFSLRILFPLKAP